MSEYLTIRETFKLLGIDEWNVRGLIKKGVLPAQRVHRSNFPETKRSGLPLEVLAIRKSDLDAYLEQKKDPLITCPTCDGSGVTRASTGIGRCPEC